MSNNQTSTKPINDKSSSQQIKKYTHLEHVLKIPDTYVGSTESTDEEHYILNEDGTKMEKKTIKYTPGEYKIFDEIMVNALDHYVRIKEKNSQGFDFAPIKNIKVSFSKEEGYIYREDNEESYEWVV